MFKLEMDNNNKCSGSSSEETCSYLNGYLPETKPNTFGRRKRPHLSSIQQTQIEVQGSTMLCFPLDHKNWFQGTINQDDDCSYTIYGERTLLDLDTSQQQSLLNNNNNKGDLDNEAAVYKVSLTDHFTGLSYFLPNITVHLDPKSPSLLSCADDAQVQFKVEQVYRGQKADMMIQKYGGSSCLLGQNCIVYSGPISLLFTDNSSTGRNWCL